MPIKDKILIGFIILIVVILGLAIKADAGIEIAGEPINCEYELAQYAFNQPYNFVMSEINIEWLKEGCMNLNNVTCGCNLPGKATIGWCTAYCINHNEGALVESKGSNPHIVNVIDIRWDMESKQYKAWVICESEGKVATVEKVYTDDFIGKLARGAYLAGNEGRIYKCIY